MMLPKRAESQNMGFTLRPYLLMFSRKSLKPPMESNRRAQLTMPSYLWKSEPLENSES